MKKPILFIIIVALLFIVTALYFTPYITPVELVLNAVKVDSDGNELGTAQIIMAGSKLDYLFQPSRIDVYIHPFDGITSIGPSNSITDFGDIPGMLQTIPSGNYHYAYYHGILENSDVLVFVRLGFSSDMTRWIFCDISNSVYYVASVDDACTTQELIEYFDGLI